MIPNAEGVKHVTITERISPVCMISGEQFDATITIHFCPNKHYLELCSVRKYLAKYKNATVESLGFKIKKELEAVLMAKVGVVVEGKSKIHPDITVTL